VPIALGGLWKNKNIDEKDIEEVRQEMWGSLEKRDSKIKKSGVVKVVW